MKFKPQKVKTIDLDKSCVSFLTYEKSEHQKDKNKNF